MGMFYYNDPKKLIDTYLFPQIFFRNALIESYLLLMIFHPICKYILYLNDFF